MVSVHLIFQVHLDAVLNAALLDQHVLMLQRPPLVADLTRGMIASDG